MISYETFNVLNIQIALGNYGQLGIVNISIRLLLIIFSFLIKFSPRNTINKSATLSIFIPSFRLPAHTLQFLSEKLI